MARVKLSIIGVVGKATLTVNDAVLLVTLPDELLTTHSYCVPLLADVTAGVVYVTLVAPLMAVKLDCPSAFCIH